MSSLLIGALAAIVVVSLFYLIAFLAKPSFDAKVSRRGELSVAMTPDEVIAKLRSEAPGQGLKVAAIDEERARIILGRGMTLLTFGYFVPITTEAAGAGTRVTVGLKTKAPQWGPAVTNAHKKAMTKVKGALGLEA